MVKPGRPLKTWTSTERGRPTAPLRVAEATEASTLGERSHPGLPRHAASRPSVGYPLPDNGDRRRNTGGSSVPLDLSSFEW